MAAVIAAAGFAVSLFAALLHEWRSHARSGDSMGDGATEQGLTQQVA